MCTQKIRGNFIIILLILNFPSAVTLAQLTGEQIFKQTCVACHKIGGGRLVGPDLKDAHNKYPQDWLLKWIKSSQSLVKAGDETAVKLFNENNKVIMPDNLFTDEQIVSVIEYIKKESASTTATVAALPAGTPGGTSATNVSGSGVVIYFGIAAIVILLLVVLVQARTIRTLIGQVGKGKETNFI